MIIFDAVSPENTKITLDIAFQKAAGLSADIVLSTTTGASAAAAMEHAARTGFKGKVIVITHVWGSKSPGTNRLENREELEAAGAVLVTAAHTLSGAERSLSNAFGGVYPVEIIAHTLRMFCQGMKVCVEVAAMALDAGAIKEPRPVVAIGGTGKGLDTACVITPGYSARIFETRVHESLCKPR
ncbi:MAG: hypothetical protein LBS19_04860 [Clostridiales bacterium]|jgi:hypothetical protein|nr:hypothetical protein [Clostridiales bacterium]